MVLLHHMNMATSRLHLIDQVCEMFNINLGHADRAYLGLSSANAVFRILYTSVYAIQLRIYNGSYNKQCGTHTFKWNPNVGSEMWVATSLHLLKTLLNQQNVEKTLVMNTANFLATSAKKPEDHIVEFSLLDVATAYVDAMLSVPRDLSVKNILESIEQVFKNPNVEKIRVRMKNGQVHKIDRNSNLINHSTLSHLLIYVSSDNRPMTFAVSKIEDIVAV